MRALPWQAERGIAPRSGRSKTLGLAALLAGVLAAYLFFIQAVSLSPHPNDFAKFYRSARNYYLGRSIYTPPAEDLPGEGGPVSGRDTLAWRAPNLNPPFQTLLFLPLGRLEYRAAYWAWSILSLLFGLYSVRVISRALGWNRLEARLGLAILLLAYFPTFTSLMLGQVSLLWLLLLAAAWSALRAGDERWAGIFLALALSLKLYTGLFLLVFLLRCRWRLLAWSAAAFLAFSLLALGVFGLEAYREYLAVLGGVGWHAYSWNASFAGFFARLGGLFAGRSLWSTAPMLASGLLLLGLAWAAWPRRPGAESLMRFDLVFSLALVVMLLVSPLGWMYYFAVLLIPALAAWRAAGTLGSLRVRALVLLAWALSTLPHSLVPPGDIDLSTALVWGGAYSYALLLWAGILLGLLRAMERQAPGGEAGQTQPATSF